VDKRRLVVTDVVLENIVAVETDMENAVEVTCTVRVEIDVTVIASSCVPVTLSGKTVIVIRSGIAVVVTGLASSVNEIQAFRGDTYQYARSYDF
jgi:hypothetical protein